MYLIGGSGKEGWWRDFEMSNVVGVVVMVVVGVVVDNADDDIFVLVHFVGFVPEEDMYLISSQLQLQLLLLRPRLV